MQLIHGIMSLFTTMYGFKVNPLPEQSLRQENINYLALPLSQKLITCAGQEELNHDCSQNSDGSGPSPRLTIMFSAVLYTFIPPNTLKQIRKIVKSVMCHTISSTFLILMILYNNFALDLYHGWMQYIKHKYPSDIQEFKFYSLFLHLP
jgi:hypothetical protein